MKTNIKLVILLVIAVIVMSCSSTLHLYSGQQYFSDEELGTLTVAEQIKVYKFNRKEVQQTPKPPVIKALPGEHRLDLNISSSEGNIAERTVYWKAEEGRIYQLTLSGTDDVTIVDVTDN